MIKRSVTLISTLLAALTLSSCATITSGTHETVAVKTGGTVGAICTLQNNKGKWTVSHTPGSVAVDRSGENLAVNCSKSGFSKTQAVSSHMNGAEVANLIVPGGSIGLIVDRVNGSAFSYPTEINVPLHS